MQSARRVVEISDNYIPYNYLEIHSFKLRPYNLKMTDRFYGSDHPDCIFRLCQSNGVHGEGRESSGDFRKNEYLWNSGNCYDSHGAFQYSADHAKISCGRSRCFGNWLHLR